MQITDFAGQHSNPDPLDVPPGAALAQVNVSTNVPGVLTPRRGIAPVALRDPQPADTGTRVLSAFLFQTPGDEVIIYHLSNGKIKQGRI